MKKAIRIAIERVCRGCFEEDEVSDKLYTEVKVNALPTFQIPCKTSAICVCYYLSPTSSILGLGYITRVEKGEKSLAFKPKTVMMEFWTEGARCSGYEQVKLQGLEASQHEFHPQQHHLICTTILASM